MVPFHLIFLFQTTIRPKIRVLTNFFLSAPTTIWPKYMVLFHLLFLWCTTIRPKIKVHINLIVLFVHDHLTKVRGYSYSLIYSFLNFANILFALFLAVLPWHFVFHIQSSTSYPYISHAIFMEVLLLYISYTISMAIWSLSPENCWMIKASYKPHLRHTYLKLTKTAFSILIYLR